MKNLPLLLISLFLSGSNLIAQSFEGRVLDKSDKPIAYALIYAPKDNIHTHSMDDGSFRIDNMEIGDTLKLSHLSYQTENYFVSSITGVTNIVLKEASISIDAVVISDDINAIQQLSDINLKVAPVNSSQEVLRKVPGLIIGQHAGGGKAEQIFLRGFDIDHGTDIAITTDGIPVNMVSHAHGQGYADLHYLIPETIDKVDFGLGPHNPASGNFSTAGYVDMRTKKSVDANMLKLELGQNNTSRLATVMNLMNDSKTNGYVAAEYLSSDGPFESSQNFRRSNIFGKISSELATGTSATLTLSHFSSSWDASGQIPQREVDNRNITRFGAIDDTEGGNTSRSNVIVDLNKILSPTSQIKNKIFLSKYDFELYSNFTFFLRDPLNGDQIKQKENRYLYGLNSEYFSTYSNDLFDTELKIGISMRVDEVRDNQLAYTRNKTEILENIKLGDVSEQNLGGYVSSRFDFGKLMINPSIRLDHFSFLYKDRLTGQPIESSSVGGFMSPKLGVYYNPTRNLQIFTKVGRGFHSNDTRVATVTETLETIPAAIGYDIGGIWKLSPQLIVNAAYWELHLEQEFVYVGDEGIVEPSGRTHRKGIDLSINYQPLDWMFINSSTNYTHARAKDEEAGTDYIPLAPSFTMMHSLGVIHPSGLSGNIEVRHLADRPATEDYAITAEGYTVVDLSMNKNFGKLNLGFQIQNLFNTEWNETQFATESKLEGETESVEEIHFTPGIPFFMKGILSYTF